MWFWWLVQLKEACKSVQCFITIRVLDDHDSLLGSISGKGDPFFFFFFLRWLSFFFNSLGQTLTYWWMKQSEHMLLVSLMGDHVMFKSTSDLEPLSQRTAQRLIAHSMGFKLPASGFGSKELRDQEAARKSRIVSRHKQRDDAWGDDWHWQYRFGLPQVVWLTGFYHLYVLIGVYIQITSLSLHLSWLFH